MSNQEPIERLYVRLEADVRELLTEGDKAIKKLERRMEDLDKAGKKAGRFDRLKKGLDQVAKAARTASIAFAAFSAALLQAFRMANQAVADLRVERSFYRLAAAAQQSGNDVLAAMQRASNGTIDALTLMQQANLAMQLGVARTPEEFEKLTSSAIALGAAVGRGPVDALNDLIVAAGRRSRLVLDNLGLSLGEVNQLMDQFARVEFGKTVDQLSQIQRDMLFTRATIEAANRKAAQLGGNLEDAGTGVQQMAAQAKNFQGEFNQLTLVALSLLNNMNAGPGILKRLTDGAIAWQRILIQIAALIMAINDTLSQAIGHTTTLYQTLRKPLGQNIFELGREFGRNLFGGQAPEEAGKSLGETFTDSFARSLAELQERFKDVLDPEAAGAGAPAVPPIDTDEVDESAQKTKDILDNLTTDILNAQRDNAQDIEEAWADHQERMADIDREGANRRAEINADLQSDLADLARDTAKRREEIFRDAERDLAELAEDTDRKLADEREDFNTEERRDTEDHLRDMRRLQQQYLFDLEDAVAARDARAVVDLQRRFALESQNREEDFGVKQRRDREDFDERLAEIRDYEARRRQEILSQRTQELQELMVNEAERRAEIERSHQEQLDKLEANLAEQRARENQNYAERQAELEAALGERLQAIARELADEEDVNEEGARRILAALAGYFGRGGEIDQLMEEFRARTQQRLVISVGFESSAPITPASIGEGFGGIPAFQHGGTLIARRPTVAMFGEAGPEVAQFTPLSQMGGGQPRRIQIEFSGSAPPGIRGGERDQIAAVVLSALRDTGALDGAR